jgi:hypothetical protein
MATKKRKFEMQKDRGEKKTIEKRNNNQTSIEKIEKTPNVNILASELVLRTLSTTSLLMMWFAFSYTLMIIELEMTWDCASNYS